MPRRRRLKTVTVCTPTWQRHELLFTRCILSVQRQDYEGRIEHIIVSDGPDPELASWFRGSILDTTPRYHELPEHPGYLAYGSYARLRATELSAGDYITYNDDDDSLRPEHCRLLATALDENPDAGFVVSRMLQHRNDGPPHVIGKPPWGPGNVGPPMVMHRREILEHGTWGSPGRLEDWEIVARWLDAGIQGVAVGAVTADVWPSMFR